MLSFYEMSSFLINTPTLKWKNSCIFMEIAVKVVEDANFFFSTEQLPLLVGSRLNLETEERGTTVKVENRL